ncbi:hypothetical protein DDZ13_10295 [Coraliomargarita sinensis]|uniref:Sulfotransferase family protein n=1 Tax=Coraliomargarita sinensis TaxID=2174842 RepID=A0A317ZEC7_9BACT|nr:sulfotransferase [Coraliomargarita sinensis]PXA03676.1 hypothetical protein DDZ13_10295 [Coraliomargarita sinensis]
MSAGKSNKTKLLVVGYPRGGTSLVGNYLAAAGMRTVVDDRRGDDYPAGFMEHLPILLFNKACERLRGKRDRLTEDSLLEESFLEICCMRKMFDDAYAVLRDPNIDFIKSPDLALALDFMIERFPGLKILGVWRKPDTAIESFYKREFGRIPSLENLYYSIGTWNMYAQRLVEFKKRYPSLIQIVSVDSSVNDASHICHAIEALGFELKNKPSIEVALGKRWRTTSGTFWKTIPLWEKVFRYLGPERNIPYFRTSANHNLLKNFSQ